MTKQILKAYKFKLDPTLDQKIQLSKIFGSVRMVYNHFLYEVKSEREKDPTSKYPGYLKPEVGLGARLTRLKHQEEYRWLYETPCSALQQSLMDLDNAFKNFFAGCKKSKKVGYPKFHRKSDHYDSFRIPTGVEVHDYKLYIDKFRKENAIKILHSSKGLKEFLSFSGKIKSCTVSRIPTKEYFVSLLVETSVEELSKTDKAVGLDMGIKSFCVTSDNVKVENPKFYIEYSEKLKSAQQHLSRKIKGSHRYENQRLKVAKIQEKIADSRRYQQHLLSKKLVRAYDIIYVEDLNVKGMLGNEKLAKSISDSSWSSFISMLEYKADWYGKTVVKVDRFFPSSRLCSCGYKNIELKLSDRSWECPFCHKVLDRDLNAAKNIKEEGLKLYSHCSDSHQEQSLQGCDPAGVVSTDVERQSDFKSPVLAQEASSEKRLPSKHGKTKGLKDTVSGV